MTLPPPPAPRPRHSWRALAPCLLVAACFNPSGAGSGAATDEPASTTAVVATTTATTTAPTSTSTTVADPTTAAPLDPSTTAAPASTSTSSPATTDTTDTTGTPPPPENCGDGVVDGLEDCDDGNLAFGDGCDVSCRLEWRYVFVTNATFDLPAVRPDIADFGCAAEAQDITRRYIAWVSTGDQWARYRLGEPDVPYRTLAGDLVADDTNQFLSGTLQHAIDRDPQGTVYTPTAMPCEAELNQVWTGTAPNGKVELNCVDWDPVMVAELAVIGDASRPDSSWTQGCVRACTGSRHLYCIQVGAPAP